MKKTSPGIAHMRPGARLAVQKILDILFMQLGKQKNLELKDVIILPENQERDLLILAKVKYNFQIT